MPTISTDGAIRLDGGLTVKTAHYIALTNTISKGADYVLLGALSGTSALAALSSAILALSFF